jgi:shikimate dehydrogenase
VNTVIVQPDGTTAGTSTDGGGFSRAVTESFGVALKDLRVLVLGAGGGAGRAVAMQCAEEQCFALGLSNRTKQKVVPLYGDVKAYFSKQRVSVIDNDESALKERLKETDLIVNCTAVGMKADDVSPIPAALLSSRHLVYDTIYVGHRTPLLRAADEAGARGENGLPMLLHQGALAFEKWFGGDAPIEAMRRGLMSA